MKNKRMNLINNNSLLSIYLQNGDICKYLNITIATKSDIDNLTNKFQILDNTLINKTIFYSIFSNFIHQQIVSECSLKWLINLISSQSYYNNALIWYEKGYWTPQIPYIIIPAFLIFVSFKKLKTNLLLPFDSFFQIFALIPFIINFIYFLFGSTIINYNICFWISLLSTVGSYSSFMTIFFISLERMLIVYFPLRMHVIPESTIFRVYILIFIICLFSGGIITLIQINVWTIINTSYESLEGRLILCNSDRPNKDIKLIIKNALYILRSVLIISLVLIIGWLIASAKRNDLTNFFRDYLSKALTNLFISNTDPKFPIISGNILTILVGIITYIYIIIAGIGPLILIICNSEYRNAYKAVFKKLIPKIKTTNNNLLFIKSVKGNAKQITFFIF
ncbi:G_PROTEIN_RECEP_F1_2 domain-containing protein [Meloidogyne graminicola]|uniref:G_PROTEIN_RECEP_F1_2 domain-containing protein n=1 Tax=Meloidogyne graminicola TaxID=189291 RepID=A0A8T0A194_9BILA|nr:G_PROTEIN_RECEP_F1_2 domain-containing protein [Meloidogyne graminicola]